MVIIETIYEGNLRCRVIHGPSGNAFSTDAPADNHGKAEYISPTDLVAGALGSCVLTVMGIVAGRKGIKLDGAKAEVTKEMASDPVRRIGTIRAVFIMPANIRPEDRSMLEKTAFACPVKQSLHPDIKIEMNFKYPDR